MPGSDMSRRAFVRVTAAAIGTMAVAAQTYAQAAKSRKLRNRDAAPRFRFAMINDPHVQAPVPEHNKHPNLPGYEGANHRMRWLVEAVGREKVDFVVGVGDLIHGERMQRLALDMQVFQKMIRELRCPFYPCMGNHENVQREGDPRFEKAYCEAFGRDRVNYTFVHGGIRFVILNNSGAPGSNKRRIGRTRNDRVRRVLEETRGQPKILCCHIPLISIRDEAVLKKSFGFRSYKAHDAEVLDLVNAHSDAVIAVLSGHIHLTSAVQNNGVYHIVPSGAASYPHDYATFNVYDDRIHVRMHSVPGRLWVLGTNIHGSRRHMIDHTDKDHPSHESYLRGNPSERTFDIALDGRKRPTV